MDSSGTTSGPPLRWYQQKCVDAAKGENLLVVLPTNSGKTRIAAELLDHYLTQWRCDSSASKKRKWCVLLTPTGPLADQQGLVLAQSCGLDLASEADDEDDAEGASHRLAIVRGQHTNRSKRAINAHNAWRRCATLVMTPALLVDSLIHARVVITDVVLLVLDEAHQLKGTSEYAILMKRFYSGAPAASRPRVLALTASPLSGRAPGKSWQPASEEDMKRELDELEEKVDCRTWTELGLVEAELLKTTVEERSFEMANSTERHKKLLEMIRSAKLEVSGNNRQRDQILRWNRTLERFEGQDGERCGIALELGEWATLRGLQLLCRGQAAELEEEDGKDEEKSNGEDEKVKNLEPEELICEARERLQGKLAQWQEKQTEKIHSSKALACIQKLRERFQADGGDMKCIVFTRTRALCQLLAMVLESEEGLPGVTYVVGGNDCRVSSWRIRQTATSQKQALAKFARPHNEEGAVSIVVATSVLAEGIDIPSCGLVLCFDSAVSPLQHVQLRGRARRARSEFTVLVPKGPKGPKGPLGALAAGPSLQQLKDYEVGVLNVLKAWSLRPSCPRPKLGPVSEEEVLEVNSSGARLPLEKAKNYLHVQVYGYLIPSEKSNEREILDFCKPGFRDNEKKYDYSMFQVKSSEKGWYSELELPPVGCCSMSLEEQTSAAAACDHSWWRKKEKPLCQEHLGMVVGPVVTQKGQAKDAAALRACRILHEMGILDDYLKVKGREKFQHLIKQATGSGKASGKRRSDDAIALASIETLERKLPRCLRLPETETELETFQLHRLVLGEHPGKHGLALLLPEKVPSGVTRFLLLPPGLEEPLQVEVQWLAEVEFSQQQLDDLKVWTQLSLELSCRRTCPLHQAFGQVPLTHFKDRSGRWVPATNAGAIGEDEDLPDRSYWLLAPMAPGSQAIHWDFVHWGLTSLNHLLQCESWQQMSSCFVGETKTLHLDMSLSDVVVLGLMPTTQRGSDVRCLCVDLEVQEDQSGLMKGYKFSRASVNAGVAPDFIKADRNLHQERLEIEFKADDCELIPLTLGQLQVLRSFPSLLWRLEFVALIKELQDGLLQRCSLNVLGEALTHSQVRSLPFELPNYRFCLERLELLGDAALKLMASVHCGSCLPTAKEGELSKAAQEFETNKWLRHASKASWDLAQYILLEAFRPKDLVAGLRRGTAPQKVVADAMEAVLGAVFRSAAASATGAALGTGIAETWRIFGALQKSAIDQSKIHLQESFIPDFKDAALAALSSLRPTALTADELQSAKDAVLQATGYEFRRAELLGALRANASGSRSTSFERLEFLGDAVLQVLVSWHVMQLFPEFDEGELSDTQQALVCNYYISRKLVRNFDEASLLHVFFPGAQSPLRSPLRKYLKAVRGQEAGDFLVGEKSDLAAGLQRNDPGTENSRYKFIADAYEALMAAILLDTGGDLDQTWRVFAKDFDLSKVNVQEQIRGWRQHLREAEKKELIESGVLLPQSRAAESKPLEGGRPLTSTTATAREAAAPAEPPVFGLLAKGEARRKLMEYCKRLQLKMKFEGSQEGDVFKSRVIVDGKKYMEGEGASSSAAQDLASEMALWQLQHPPQDPVPPVEVEGELPNAPGSIQAVERPKGLARKELQKYCNSVVQKFRFKELEVVQMDNSKMFQMQVVLGDRIFPKGQATTKPAAQDMAAELALLELRGGEELDQGASRPVGPSPAPPPPPPPAVTLPVPAERPKGIDRQELQFLCQRRGWTLTWQEQAEGPSHLRSFRASAVVHKVAYPEAQALTKNAAKDLAAFLALQSLSQATTQP